MSKKKSPHVRDGIQDSRDPYSFAVIGYRGDEPQCVLGTATTRKLANALLKLFARLEGFDRLAIEHVPKT